MMLGSCCGQQLPVRHRVSTTDSLQCAVVPVFSGYYVLSAFKVGSAKL